MPQFTSSGIMDRWSATDLLDKEIDVIFMQRNETDSTIVLGQYFDTENKDSGLSHIIGSMTSQLSLPPINEDGEPMPFFTAAPGFKKTFLLYGRRMGVQVTDTMMKAQHHKRITEMVSGQMKAANRKDEYARASIFNNAFTGTDGADSKPLCDDSHPHENKDRGTWDNKITGALTGGNLQAARLLGRKIDDPQGDPDPLRAMDVVVPEDLEQKALELTQSANTAENMLNTKTVLIGKLKPVVSVYLGTASSVQWFLMGDRTGYAKGLHEIVLIPWNIKDMNPGDPDIVIQKRIKSVREIGFTVSKNMIGSTGS